MKHLVASRPAGPEGFQPQLSASFRQESERGKLLKIGAKTRKIVKEQHDAAATF